MRSGSIYDELHTRLYGKVTRERSDFYLTHDFHPYYAAFPPKIPREIIDIFSHEHDVVLDNFCGGGTALVEALLLRRNAIGVDISPLACLIARVKTTPLNIDTTRIKEFLFQVRKDLSAIRKEGQQSIEYYESQSTGLQIQLPKITNVSYWFRSDIQKSLATILWHIENVSDDKLKDFLKVCLSSVLRKVSNTSNLESHPCREEGKKIPDIYEVFSGKLSLMCTQMMEYSKLVPKDVKATICSGEDSRELANLLGEETVDLIVTSPPYGTGSNYTEIYRFSFEWLSLPKPPGRKPLEKSRKFVDDLEQCMEQMYSVLKPGKHCFMVIGNPSKKNFLDIIIKDARRKIGFKTHGFIDCPIVKKTAKYHKYHRFTPSERVLIFQKP